MNKDLKKAIDNLVWFIPNKKLRDSIRTIVSYKIEKTEELDNKLSIIINELNNINKYDSRSIIIAISGGFTDQIFFYILGKYIELEFNVKVEYDISWYNECGYDYDFKFKRNFELLNIFHDININITDYYMAKKYKLLSNHHLLPILESQIKNLIDLNKTIYLSGYFGEITFYNKYKELFDKIFDFDKYLYKKLDNNNLNIYKEIISSQCPVAIHIRLGDLFNDYHNSITNNYILDSMELISNSLTPITPKFFIFSNDINYVQNNIFKKLHNSFEYKFVDCNNNDKGYLDFYLITKCHHVIASINRFAYCAYNFIKNDHKILIFPNTINNYIISDFQNSNAYNIEEKNNKFIITNKNYNL